ncbi:MAG: tetratricopeptide repeat protein [Sandaracinaceae bacterium]
MNGMRPASRVGACALAVASLAIGPSPLRAQECIAPDVQHELTSCEGLARVAPRRPGHAGPSALPSAAPDVARPSGATPPGPDLAPPDRRPGTEGLRRRQYRLLGRERQVLERLLARMDERDPQRADVLERLAGTLSELVLAHDVRARSLDEPIFEARQAGDAARVRTLVSQQSEAESAARADREAAVRTLATLVAGFPDRPRLDEALYSLALLLEETEQAPRAMQVYHRLLRDFPQSRYVPHAYLAFAERAFAQGQLDDARQFYERVLTIPAERNELYGYALYKLAWVRYNQEDFRGSLDAFVRVLEHTRQHPDRSSSAALARQARRELVMPYARTGRPDRALAFFRRVAAHEDEAQAMLESLAQLYFDTGAWPETIRVHHQLMAEAPDAESVCGWQARVLDATIASAPKDDQVREARRLADVRRAYARARHLPDHVERCDRETATALLLLSTAWHREAVGTDDAPGTRDRATMGHAVALYDILLEHFADLGAMTLPRIDRRDRPTTAEIASFSGELLYELGRYDDCAQAFERALDAGAAPQLAADAAYGAVLCHDRRLGSREPPPTADDRALTRRELTEDEARMARTFHRFSCVAPEHEELAVVLYRWARIHYEANQLQEAAELFRRVATEHPSSEVGEYAANLWLDSLGALAERRGREACYATLEGALEPIGRAFCGDPTAHPELCGVTGDLVCELGARRIAHLSGDPANRARRVLDLVREHQCREAPRLLYDAAIWFEQARLLGAAIRVRSVLVQSYSNDPLARRAIFLIGANYHALAIYELAAEWYERYVNDGGACAADDGAGPCPDASEGLRNAVTFRLGLGQTEEALAGEALFQQRFGRASPRVAAAVAFDIGAVHERTEDWPRLVEHYRGFLRRHARAATPGQRAAAHVAIVRGLIRQGQRDAAARDLAAAVEVHERGGEAAVEALDLPPEAARLELYALRSAVAEARYEQAEALRLAYEAVRFPILRGTASIERVQRWAQQDLLPWVQRKQAMIHDAEEAYALVAPLGIPRWRIAAASRLGDMYLSLVEQVRGSPIPDVIARYPEALAAYETALDEATEEPAGVAVTRYQSCLSTATDVRWFDERSRRCERALNQLDAARYPIAAELRGSPTYEPRAPARPGAPRLGESEG